MGGVIGWIFGGREVEGRPWLGRWCILVYSIVTVCVLELWEGRKMRGGRDEEAVTSPMIDDRRCDFWNGRAGRRD